MSISQQMFRGFIAVFAVLVLFGAQASDVQAQSYYYQQTNPAYMQFTSTKDYIAYLQSVVIQLQTLLAQQNNNSSYNSTYTYTSNSEVYDVEVETNSAKNIDDESASLYGEVDLDDAPYAYVYFEYGTDSDLDEETDDIKIDDSDNDTFKITIDDLDEDEKYYFRAVAEDPSGYRIFGSIERFFTDDNGGGSNNHHNGDEPYAETDNAEDVDEDSAELTGEVDMNDFDDGRVFFVYGQDEDQVEDVEDEDEYSDIDEDGIDLQKYTVEDNFDGSDSFYVRLRGLSEDEEYYFRICVEYEDEDDDETLECGDVESFETDDDGGSSHNNDDEPEAHTLSTKNVDENGARIYGEVDMNDFKNGLVFFVYGQDEDQVEDVEDEDEYSDIDEDGEDLQTYKVDSDLDGEAEYWIEISGLDDDTEYYFRICVEYEDEDDDLVLTCGDVRQFQTDED